MQVNASGSWFCGHLGCTLPFVTDEVELERRVAADMDRIADAQPLYVTTNTLFDRACSIW
jgi:hypothetical protein